MEHRLGIAEPLFLFELAEMMNKSIRELTTGEPGMSAHELCVLWPAYFEVKETMRKEAEQASQ